MSATEVAGHLRIDGPAPRERMHSLLTVPGVLVEVTGDHWRSGVALWGYPEEVPSLWEGCTTEGTFRVKDSGGDHPNATFTSFVLYVPIDCTALGIGDPNEFADRAAQVLKATQAYAIEQALSQGVTGLSNPYLGDANLTVLATNKTPLQGLSYLENAIAATGRQGLIHLTPAVSSSLEPVCQREDASAPLYTGAGTPIAVGAGYVGTDPVLGASPDANSDWIFATGPVEVRIESEISMVPESISQALDREMNDVVYRAEKVAVVSWDTALQAGVLVDWST